MPKEIMPDFINVAIHRSAQPDEFMASLRRSFERRAIDPKFHYTGAHQAQSQVAANETQPTRDDYLTVPELGDHPLRG